MFSSLFALFWQRNFPWAFITSTLKLLFNIYQIFDFVMNNRSIRALIEILVLRIGITVNVLLAIKEIIANRYYSRFLRKYVSNAYL